MSKEIQEFDDDLDDLDDYLDDFDEEILSKEPGETILNKGDNLSNNKSNERNETEINFNEDPDIDDITKLDPEFTKQMENFMNMLDPNNNGNSLNDLLNNSKPNDNKEINFQQSVNETIDRLKNSSQQVEEESTKNMNKDEELLTTLLNSLDIDGENGEEFEGFEELKGLLGNKNGKEGDIGEEGENSDDVDKLTNIVMKMLNRLTSKEMMYDSVNSAVENYQVYFKNHNKEDEDHQRYQKQLQHLENVKRQFDSKDYNENDEKIRDIIDKEMEDFNKLLPPPPGVIQDNLADLGLDNVKWNDKEVPDDLEGCVQQ